MYHYAEWRKEEHTCRCGKILRNEEKSIEGRVEVTASAHVVCKVQRKLEKQYVVGEQKWFLETPLWKDRRMESFQKNITIDGSLNGVSEQDTTCNW